MQIDDAHFQQHDQTVELSFAYPVIFTRNAFAAGNDALANVFDRSTDTTRMIAFVDEGLHQATPGLLQSISDYATAHEIILAEAPIILPGGEAVKNGWTHVSTAVDAIVRNRLCRHSYALVIGGGAFLDAIGFAASLVHRGVRLIRMPSTTLSQDDSGVGVKNGINLSGQKNMLGVFAPPHAVINDAVFLSTLPRPVMLDGIAEAFKVAIIKDAEFFHFLADNAEAISRQDARPVEEAVRHGAMQHLEHIRTSGDPYEQGAARPLDFGHWAAHRLESMSGYEVRHGEAVAIGIAIDTLYARSQSLVNETECKAVLNALSGCGLRLYHPLLEATDASGRPAVLEGIEQFREHLGGQLTITLPNGIGNRIEVNTIDEAAMIAALNELKTYENPRSE